MGAILKRELSSYFNSAIAYVVMGVFFFFSGLFFYVYCISGNSSSLAYVFSSMFFIIIFAIPVITMKTFSEEKRQKTDQALLTAPTSLTEIAMGKFFGAFILYAICCLIMLVYAVVISFFAVPQWSVILCTMLGILLLGGALIAINVFISSLTESVVIAAVISMGVNLLIYFMNQITGLIPITWITTILGKLDFVNYYSNFTYGLLNVADVIFFVSVIGLFIFFTVRVLEKKRWS